LKANAAAIANELKEDGEAYVITQNGEAAMVVQSVKEYEHTQESLAMLKMLNQSEKDFENGDFVSAKNALENMKRHRGL